MFQYKKFHNNILHHSSRLYVVKIVNSLLCSGPCNTVEMSSVILGKCKVVKAFGFKAFSGCNYWGSDCHKVRHLRYTVRSQS